MFHAPSHLISTYTTVLYGAPRERNVSIIFITLLEYAGFPLRLYCDLRGFVLITGIRNGIGMDAEYRDGG